MIRNPATRAAWAPLPVRLATGGGLAYHGFPKLFTRSGHENIVYLLRESGTPAPELVSWPVGCLEFFGGLALMAGYRVRPVAGAVLGMVAFNFASQLRRGGLPAPLPGGQPLPDTEASAFYGGCSLSLFLTGAGRWALSDAS
jgi:putative oxidoreductase